MSIFNELLPKINEISNAFTKNFNDDLKAAFDCFDKYEEELRNGRGKARDKAPKDKNPMNTLQSIHEDEDEPSKSGSEASTKSKSSTISISSTEERRVSQKRSKHEVDGMSSPEQDKRQKRNASVKAQSIISKQVNVNLTQKMRRDDGEKSQSRRRKEDKENDPLPINIQIKAEKISLPPEPMDTESLPVKKEMNKDDFAMPPPTAPVPKPRKAAKEAKEKTTEAVSDEESSGKRRTTRTRKQTDSMAPPPVPSSRSTRASSRSTRQLEQEEAIPEGRPKRTRAKKKVSEPPVDSEKDATQPSIESGPASPAEKPRPKRTRRGQKAAEKPQEPPQEKPIPPKEEPISNNSSPILQKEPKKLDKKTVPIEALDKTQVISSDMDKTMVIPNGVYNHAPVTPTNVRAMNETVVIEAATRETVVLDKPPIMDCTVVLDKAPLTTNVTEDNSLLTDDSDSADMYTPPKHIPQTQPASAVKEKVQQFEELASRVTRTKTRAMAKKQEDQPDSHTPPDKIIKPVLSVETLNKMNNMIFNGKPPQISSSATKPRPTTTTKSYIPSSTSKLSTYNKKEEESKREKEDARKKKEAMLEAKRELQKRKREEKAAAVAAARAASEKERHLAMLAAERERRDKQAHADLGKIERLREAERKKAELARKVAETEERRKAEEHARAQRLADEQRRADDARRKQLEEAAATKKEAAIMAKEIEKRQKEYIEKQKMKQRLEDKCHTPLKSALGLPPMEPVCMSDGFQFLCSDEEEEPADRPVPDWSTSKGRKAQLMIQSQIRGALIDRLFSVRVHSPDLRELFPQIDRARLKRTSSAVWRTPPSRLAPLDE